MLQRVLLSVGAIVFLSSGLLTSAQEALPLPVFVTVVETKPLPPLRPEQHEATINGTRTEMYDRASQLRKQHGDKTSNWPPEVWKEFYLAEDAHTMAVARRDYQAPETRLGLADSVEDFLRGVGDKNKEMTMVSSADQASLVVPIIGRRRIVPKDVTDNRYFIRFRIAPGGTMTPARFHELTYGHKWNNLWTKLLAHPTDASPYVELEAGSPASYKNCAASVRAIVQSLIHERLAKKKS